MKRILAVLIFVMFAAVPVVAQTGAVQNHCFKGGTKAVTSGLSSTNYLDGIIPSCQITVYLTGTTTKATIYADNISTPLGNPFTAHTAASVDPGGWIFWAATNAGLDVVMSGGISPNTYAQPVTLTDVFPSQSFNPVSGVTSLSATAPIEVNGGSGPATGGVTVSCADATNSTKGCSRPDGTTITAAGGVLSGASISNGLVMQSASPAAGTYIKVYPSGVSVSPNDVQYLSTGSLNAADVRNVGCTVGSCTGTGPAQVQWTYTLPSYVNPSNVTAVYGSTSVAAFPVGNNTGFAATGAVSCTQGVSTFQLISPSPTAYGPYYKMQQFNALLTAVTGAQVSTITCKATVTASSSTQAGVALNVSSIYLQLADSVDTAPAANTIQVAPPLYYNQASNTLGMYFPPDLETDTGAANAYVVTDTNMTMTPGTTLRLIPAHNSTSTTPTLALNGVPAQTIVGPTGGALASGDLLTTAVANVIYGPNGLWWLQNPQTTAGGGTTVNVNGVPITNPNFNDSTPSPDPGYTPGKWKVSGSNILVELPAGVGSPLTTKGDIYTFSTTNARLGVGVDGSSLLADSAQPTGLRWGTPTTSGVQYNPSNTLYLWAGPDSIVGDDTGGIYGTLIPLTSWSQSGGVCTFTSTGPHGLSLNEWFTPNWAGSWPATPSPFALWTAGYTLFQVASVPDSTHWTASCPNISASGGTGGNAENANYFLPFLTSTQPFFNGHGSTTVILPTGSTLVSMDTNFATVYAPTISAWLIANPGASVFLIISGGRNDMQFCTSTATLEGNLTSIAAKAHALGSSVQVVFNTITPSMWNTTVLGCQTAFKTLLDVNNFAKANLKSNTNAAALTYFDRVTDPYTVMNDLHNSNYFLAGGALSSNGKSTYAAVVNEGMSTQSSTIKGYPDDVTSGYAANNYGRAHLLADDHGAESWWDSSVGLVWQFDTLFHVINSTYQLKPGSILIGNFAVNSSGDVQTGNLNVTGTCTGCGSSPAWGTITGTLSAQTDLNTALGLKAPLASPTFTGTPAAPTAAPGTNTTQLASTAFVQAAITAGGTAFGGGLGTSYQDVTEIAAPANPAAGNDRLYTNNITHKLACLTSGGADCMPTTAGGSHVWSCQPGIGDGLNAVTAGTYLQSTCKNTTGVTVTLTGLQCFTDNSGSSTMNAAGNTLGALLTGAVTCSTAFAAGTQSANVLLTSGDYIKFTFVADGTSKQSTWVVTGTY